MQVPSGAVNVKFEIPFAIPHPISTPAWPVVVTASGKVAVKGSATYRQATTKVSATLNKSQWEFEQKAKMAWGELKLKGEIKPGSVSKVAVGFDGKDFPISLEFAANADFTKPFTLSVKWPRPLVIEKTVGFDWTFKGEATPQIDFDIKPNVGWTGWPSVAEAMVKSGKAAVEAGGSAVRGVFFAGEAGTATVAGTAITAGAAALAYVGWIGFGLYQIGKAHRDGRTLAVRYAFANGYASGLADLTSPTPSMQKAEVEKLLELDWKKDLVTLSDAYIGGSGAAPWVREIERFGKAAIAQDADRFIKEKGRAAWDLVRQQHHQRYGDSYMARRQAYIALLYSQAKDSKGELGIQLAS